MIKNIKKRFFTFIGATDGNGEIVAVLVAVGIAVTLGLIAVTKIGSSAKSKSDQLGGKITAIAP